MVTISTMLAMFAIAPVVYGGITWSGIDPIFTVDGHRFNVRIEFPIEYSCDVDGPIDVKVAVPAGAHGKFIMESAGVFGDCLQVTHTTLVRKDNYVNKIAVGVRVNTDEEFRVRVKVDLDGIWVKSTEGDAGKWVVARNIRYDSADEGGLGLDPALENRGDGYNYSYEDDQGEDED